MWPDRAPAEHSGSRRADRDPSADGCCEPHKSPATQARGLGGLPRVGYLGPEGTFTEEALLASAVANAVEPVALRTIYDTIAALGREEVEWAVVPIENSLDGSVTVTLDLLAAEETDVEIVGEVLLSVRHSLIACASVELQDIETVLTHPQVPGQCERFLRGELSHARVLPASSTAEAVRIVVAEGRREQAALGTLLAARIYGGTVIRDGVQDRDDNETRFVWLARAGAQPKKAGGVKQAPGAQSTQSSTAGAPSGAQPGAYVAGGRRDPPLRSGGAKEEWKTSLVFWGPGADSAGWLVRCLDEFSRRQINMTKIESRPKRERMGNYMFFVDVQGSTLDGAVTEAIEGLRSICEQVRVLGSYRCASPDGDSGGVGGGANSGGGPAPDGDSDRGVDRPDGGADSGETLREGSMPPLHSGAADG